MGSKTPSEKQRQMLEAPEGKLLIALAAPAVYSQLISIIYNIVDTYLVSHIGTEATAAVGIVYSLSLVIYAISYGPAMGSNSLVSRCIGAGRVDQANQYTISALVLSIVMGLLVTLVVLPARYPLMRFLGATDELIEYSVAYGVWLAVAAPVICGEIVLSMSLRAEGTSLPTTIALCIGGVCKIALEPILITKCGLGVAGASISTLIGEGISFSLLLTVYLSGKSVVKLQLKNVSRNIRDYVLLLRTGVPSVARQFAGVIASVFMNRGAAPYGAALIAAISIHNKIYQFCRAVVVGIGHGYQAIAGYNFGAGKIKRVRRTFKLACAFGTVLCSCFMLIIFTQAPALVNWFRDDPDVVTSGTVMLRAMALALPMLSYSTFVNQLYQCLGFSGTASFLASCRQAIFFVPVILVLSRCFGMFGIQIAQPVSDTLTFLISIPFQIAFYKRHLQLSHDLPKSNSV